MNEVSSNIIVVIKLTCEILHNKIFSKVDSIIMHMLVCIIGQSSSFARF